MWSLLSAAEEGRNRDCRNRQVEGSIHTSPDLIQMDFIERGVEGYVRGCKFALCLFELAQLIDL